jgi:hypothetical protein
MSFKQIKVNSPFGLIAKIEVESAAAMTVAVDEHQTLMTVSEMEAAGTLNVNTSGELREGADLKVFVSADSTSRVLTLGDGLTGNNFTVTASKSFVLSFVYIGGSFVNYSTLQLD